MLIQVLLIFSALNIKLKFIIICEMGFKWLQKDLSRALKSAGNKDRYQYILVGILCVIFFLNIFLIIGSSIYFMDPVFRCGNDGKTYDEAYACQRLTECVITNDFTIVYKMRLYCSEQYKRSLIQSSLAIGSLLGLIIMNVISDIKGRRFALLVDLFIATLSALLTYIGAVVQNTPLLVLSSIMSGFSGYSLIIIAYIILGDVCEESMRQKYSVYINLCLSLGLCMFYVIYNWCPEWYNILILFMFVPLTAITLVCYFFIEQSPNYYIFQQRNPDACTKTLINIAKINSKRYSDVQRIKYIINKLKKKMEIRKKDFEQNPHDNIIKSLKKWKYLKVIICMSFVQAGGNLCFYGIGFAINDIGYSFGAMNLAIGLTEIATTLVVGKYITNLYRKQTLAIVYGIAPICTTLFMFQIVSSSPLLSTILILIIRVMTTSGYFMIVMIQTQSFPLEIQSIGAGSIEGFSQFGSFAAPLLNAFSINHGLSRVSTMGFAMILCTLPLIFVSESSSLNLRKQIRQSERLVKSESVSM